MSNTKTNKRTMKQEELKAAFTTLGCRIRPQCWDESADGETVITTYGIMAILESTGSMIVRTIRETDLVDPEQVVKEMKRDLKARVKATKAAIRSEREPS